MNTRDGIFVFILLPTFFHIPFAKNIPKKTAAKPKAKLPIE